MIAQVVFNLPLDRAFDYVVPSEWDAQVHVGARVLVPFGPRRLIGYVRALQSSTRIAHPKALLRLVDEAPLLDAESLALARWLSEHAWCSVGEACAAIIPTALRPRAQMPSHAAPSIPSLADLVTLTAPQQRALTECEIALKARRSEVFLVHGVTGSGKTELYLRAITSALQAGRGAICLVPEIALTPQILERFRQRFGDAISVWHSRLTPKQRAQEWQRLREGSSRIVVGTRSAVFAPVQSLGMIIVDEEHDDSYKQQDTPRYHARAVALERVRQAGAIAILGSATPAVESFYAAKQGRYRLLELPERVRGRPLPTVDIIDMREELMSRNRAQPFSRKLQQALHRVCDQHEQAILLLNRRGFARVAQCGTCGEAMRCPHCAIPLIYHASSRQLHCHYCNTRQEAPELCPACRKGYLRFKGAGTERIESELHRLFPGSAIGRMDTDATRGRTGHQRIYESLRDQQLHMVVGTQMVAKGHDFPQVTLVGVVSADTALNLPDFRAGERTFDLLTQVAGRAGRGDRPGRVLIQTFCPTHYAIQAASRHDYHAFYRQELIMRKRLKLPPFSQLVELTVVGRSRERVQAVAEALREALAKRKGKARITILGPAPHRIATMRGTTRWRVLLQAGSFSPMRQLVREVLGEGRRFQGLPVVVDVDPR